ncbi:hypothetical protein C1H46_032093 [Malus baccata]|uniref:Uncharacterized protein n=1 Tax=Malus baccata TaxID=106549 RepID=A0A540L7A8_MALBA|nr:hypothetical protein C1H46_032093 [Malus baccata]
MTKTGMVYVLFFYVYVLSALQTHLRRPPENPRRNFDRRPTPDLNIVLTLQIPPSNPFQPFFPKALLPIISTTAATTLPQSTTHFPPKSHLKLFQFQTRHARRRSVPHAYPLPDSV